MADGPKILGIDEDKAAQGPVAQAFNQAGLFYRFISDRKKAAGGLRQLQPDLLVVFGGVGSDLLTSVLETVSGDVNFSNLPIALFCDDDYDNAFVTSLRSGVVALFKLPFAQRQIAELKMLLGELPVRTGVVHGHADSHQLSRLVEHLRKTRRSGVLTLDPRSPNEARATFALGKLESARHKNKSGLDALLGMVAQPQAQWTFSEVGGQSGDGAGVVIEVGEPTTGEEEVVAGVIDEPLGAFEVAHVAPPPAPAAPAVRAAQVPPIRLLLVDDDEALCRMFSTLFQKHGFQVTSTADGVEGFEAALRAEFDAVIADLNMPRLDGWGMLRLMRDDFRTRELPVAFLSCHDDYRESLKAHNAGAQAYFSKGSRLDSLVGQVQKLLEPRARAKRALKAAKDCPIFIAAVGPQWLLREAAAHKLNARLDAKDGWATYQLLFNAGTVTHATAQSGRYTADAERAFNAFVASRGAEGTLTFGTHPGPHSVFSPTDVMLERACSTLNENESRLREGLLVSANQIEVHADLYAVYRQVGPKQWLEVARLMCEENVPPREVIAQLDASPLDVEETLKDLVRRGVVTLKRA